MTDINITHYYKGKINLVVLFVIAINVTTNVTKVM